MGEIHRPEVSEDVIDRVDAIASDAAAVDVSRLPFEEKVKIVLDKHQELKRNNRKGSTGVVSNPNDPY